MARTPKVNIKAEPKQVQTLVLPANFEISPEMSEGITKFCQEIGVEWGRIDFMKKVDSPELQFLEMNMNGQWVFLDFENEHGLIDEVVEYIENSPTHSHLNLRSSQL
jgi:hypothetical protein